MPKDVHKGVQPSAARLDQYKAGDIIAFLEDQYVLPETRKLIQLEEWQKEEILLPVFGTKRKDGTRQYNQALVGMPKKNGKSAMSAGVGIFFMFCDEESGEIIVAANDKDQASMIIYSKMRQAIRLNPILGKGVHNYRDRLEVKSTGTIARAVPNQMESAAGLNPNLVIFDELWGFNDRGFFDELTTVPTRRSPLTWIGTYAGFDTASLLYELYERGLAQPDTPNFDPRMFCYWSNENKASWVSQEYLDQQRRRLPPNVYARLHENKWAPKTAGFITAADISRILLETWTMQLVASPESQYRHMLACDLGLVKDRTALAVGHLNTDDQRVYLDYMKTWQGSPESPVEIADVEAELKAAQQRFRASAMVLDPWQLQSTIQRLRGLTQVIPFNFNADMTLLSETLVDLMRNERLVIYNDPGLIKELSQILARQTTRGWRIDHKSAQHNDRVVALGMLCVELIRASVLSPDFYS